MGMRMNTRTDSSSRRCYIQGSRPDLRVPFREVVQSSGAEQDVVRLYDTSGPHGDPDQKLDPQRGIPPVRQPWVLEIDQIDVVGYAADITDHSATPPIEMTLAADRLQVAGIAVETASREITVDRLALVAPNLQGTVGLLPLAMGALIALGLFRLRGLRSLDRESSRIVLSVTVAVFALSLEMESVLVRGRFSGYRRYAGLRAGAIDIDWVYNSMPPLQGPIYPVPPFPRVPDRRDRAQ